MKRRLFAVALTALLPALGILIYNELSLRHSKYIEIEQYALEESRQASLEVQRIIEGVSSLLTAASAIPSLTNGNVGECRSTLSRLVEKVPAIRTLVVLDLDGALVCDSIDSASGQAFGDRSYFRDALTKSTYVIGEFTKSRMSGAAVLPISLRLENDRHDVVGVIVTGIRLEWLNERLIERQLARGAAITIADRAGIIVARQPFFDRFLGDRIPDDFHDMVFATAPGVVDITSRDGTKRIIGFKPVSIAPIGLYVSAGVSKDEAFATINRFTAASLILIVLGAIASFTAAWFIGTLFIRRPISVIVDTVQRWKGGETAARTGMTAPIDDVATIGQSLDLLLDELGIRREKAEIAEGKRELLMREMQHRVKNLLNIILAFAYQTFRDPGEREKLSKFSARLTSLSAAYDLLLRDQTDDADLKAIIENALLPFRSATQSRFNVEGDSATLPASAVIALSLVLHELATNATKYGALSNEHGKISVRTRVERSDALGITLEWREHDGPAIAQPEKQGFGTKLIQSSFPAEFGAKVDIDFNEAGLACTIDFSVRAGT